MPNAPCPVVSRSTVSRLPCGRVFGYSCDAASAAAYGRLPEWPKGAVCKTVGSAYVGSNPTPATTCENGPLAGNSRLCGLFLLCPVVCHLVALRAAVSRCPRTHSGRDSCPITVGVHHRLFHGRPRTGRAGGMFRLYARRSAGSWHLGDRDDGVPASGTPGLMSIRRTRPSLAPSPRQTEPGCPVGGSARTCTPSAGTGPRP